MARSAPRVILNVGVLLLMVMIGRMSNDSTTIEPPSKKGEDVDTHLLAIPKNLADITITVPPAATTMPPAAVPATTKKVLPASICRRGARSIYEILLESLFGMFFQEEGLVPPGAVLDVGAQIGEKSCHIALTAPDRIVYAMDPSPINVGKIRDSGWIKDAPNVRPVEGAVGDKVSTIKGNDKSFGIMGGGEEIINVTTLDVMFFDKGEALGFAHIDVEGQELDMLKGGMKTILRDQPIMTLELRVHQNPEYSRNLIDKLVSELGYIVYVIDEVCGFPYQDIRNLLAIPRKMGPKVLLSHAFNFALASEAIFQVTKTSIFDTVYPCCAAGAECCPGGDVKAKDCCSMERVGAYLDKNNIYRPAISRTFKEGNQGTLKRWYRLRTNANKPNEDFVNASIAHKPPQNRFG